MDMGFLGFSDLDMWLDHYDDHYDDLAMLRSEITIYGLCMCCVL